MCTIFLFVHNRNCTEEGDCSELTIREGVEQVPDTLVLITGAS